MCFIVFSLKKLWIFRAGKKLCKNKQNPDEFLVNQTIQERMNDPNNPYTVDQFTYVDQSDRFVGAPKVKKNENQDEGT